MPATVAIKRINTWDGEAIATLRDMNDGMGHRYEVRVEWDRVTFPHRSYESVRTPSFVAALEYFLKGMNYQIQLLEQEVPGEFMPANLQDDVRNMNAVRHFLAVGKFGEADERPSFHPFANLASA